MIFASMLKFGCHSSTFYTQGSVFLLVLVSVQYLSLQVHAASEQPTYLRSTTPRALDTVANFTWPPAYNSDSDTSSSSERILSSDAIPAVMVAVAASVIACATALYISDLRDRWYHERFYLEHQMEPKPGLLPPPPPPSITSPWPHPTQFVEEISISPVSTMTASLAMDSHGFPHSDCSDNFLDESVDITELSERNRVAQETDLHSLVDLSQIPIEPTTPTDNRTKDDDAWTFQDTTSLEDNIESYISDDEDESGWTSSAGRSESSSEMSISTYLNSIASTKSRTSRSQAENRVTGGVGDLFGEHCLEDSSNHGSLQRSPDTTLARDDAPNNELHQLDQLCRPKKASLLEQLLERGHLQRDEEELEEESDIQSNPDYVHSIFYVPVSAAATAVPTLGVEVEDSSASTSSHPSIRSVHDESPLRGRLFEGDVILAVNNEGTVGLKGDQVVEKMQDEESVVKLTVLSQKCDTSVNSEEICFATTTPTKKDDQPSLESPSTDSTDSSQETMEEHDGKEERMSESVDSVSSGEREPASNEDLTKVESFSSNEAPAQQETMHNSQCISTGSTNSNEVFEEIKLDEELEDMHDAPVKDAGSKSHHGTVTLDDNSCNQGAASQLHHGGENATTDLEAQHSSDELEATHDGVRQSTSNWILNISSQFLRGGSMHVKATKNVGRDRSTSI